MKKSDACPFESQRDDVLVSYLYDDISPELRDAFEAHLPGCPPCRTEVASLRQVREELGAWASPEPNTGVGGTTPRVALRLAPDPVRDPAPPARRALPSWLQAAAAVVLFAAGMGLANLQISLTGDGVTIRTGWLHPATGVATSAPPARGGDDAGAPAVAPAPASAPVAAPWQQDLATLEQSLRAELAAQRQGGAATDADAVVRRVRALIAESEQRQQRELALRVAEVAREAQVQRQADLVKIDRSLGLLQSRTGVEVMRTQRQLNSLAQQVSQRP